jgi:uncharacterized membrane protein
VRRDRSDDDRLDRIVHLVMRVGVGASGVLLALGLIGTLARPDWAASGALMTAGLIVLMATPVTRVAASIVEYSVERDWLFVALTSVVLVEIVGSVFAALVFHRRL